MWHNLRETIVGEFFLQSFHQGLADVVLLVVSANAIQLSRLIETYHDVVKQGSGDVRFELVSLVDTRASSDRANVDHSVAELNKGSTLLGELHIRNVFQTEVHQILVLILAQPLNEAVAGKSLAQTNCRQTILGKAEVEETGDIDRRGTKLLLLLDQVGTANEANGTLVAQLRKELEHFRGDRLLFNGRFVSHFPCCINYCSCSSAQIAEHTLLAGVKVPSTSNRQMVPCTGRSCRAG